MSLSDKARELRESGQNFELTPRIEDMNIAELQALCYSRAKEVGWYKDLKTGEDIIPNVGERCMLVVSEISEGFEGARKNLMDDKLPNRKMIEVEWADAIIRMMDYAGYLELDVMGAIAEKMEYNLHRPDHKIEERLKPNGKQF